MILPSHESTLFFRLYTSLIGYAASKAGGIGGIEDAKTFLSASNPNKGQARDYLFDNNHLIDAFSQENPDEFREQELAYLSNWHYVLRGKFLIVRDLKKYTVFMTTKDTVKAYGVLGLKDEILTILPYPLPMVVEAVLLPWKDQIVCDGLVAPYNITFGSGARRNISDSYKMAKSSGIITSLEPGWTPPKPVPAKKPKTPSMVRFLKKRCPESATQFKTQYGPPYTEISGHKLQEFGVWSLDGKLSIPADRLMVYPNVIRHKVLYVYAKEDKITSISVADLTVWYREDLRPTEGQRLFS